MTGVETSRGKIGAGKVGMAVAGSSSRVAAMVGLKLPIESHILQAFVTEVIKPLIRRAAGLGRAAAAADPDHYDKAWAHCDVLIAGAGPAGLSAALAAGRAGARVIL